MKRSLKLNSIFAMSVLANIIFGLVMARHIGQIQALEKVKEIYLSAACSDVDSFRDQLINYDVNALFEEVSVEAKITSTEKDKWVDHHLSGCVMKKK